MAIAFQQRKLEILGHALYLGKTFVTIQASAEAGVFEVSQKFLSCPFLDGAKDDC
jgi:hypothetical protein